MVGRAISAAAKKRGIDSELAQLLYSARGLTPEGIECVPDGQLKAVARRLDYADMPGARLAWRTRTAHCDNGRIPDSPMVGVLRDLDSLRARAVPGSVAGMPAGGAVAPASMAPMPVAGLKTRTWKPLGPINIGGRTRTLLIHPTKPATMWAGSIGGGIWRSDDSGANWAPVDDFMANLAVTSLAMSPTDSNHIYAGTGEGFGNGDAIRGGGIFETVDGTKWRPIPATAKPAMQQINRLAISADGATLLAATPFGLHRSVDAGRNTWTTVLAGSLADVKFHPTDPKLAIAGSLGGGMSLFTLDGGATWQASTHGTAVWSGRVELCYARANPNVVYASTQNDRGTIWRSTNGGQSFVARKSRNGAGIAAAYLGDQGWYANAIWAGHPSDSNFLLVGGVDLWRSTDGGDTLADISTWYDNRSAHADHHVIVADPRFNGTTNKAVWFANDGGIYLAADATRVGNDSAPPRISGWAARNKGYAVTQFFAAAVNVKTETIVAGAQDNGTLAYRIGAGDMVWKPIFGGDGGYCCADQADKKIFYGQYVFLNIHRNTDGAASTDSGGDRYISGQFWNAVTRRWEWKPPPFRIPDAFNQNALFIAPFVLDPKNSNRILAGGASLWRTDDAKAPNTPTSGPKWTSVKPPAGGFISAIAIAPDDSKIVWVGHESGQVWRTPNVSAAVPTWQQMDSRGAKPLIARRMCTQILVSSHDRRRVLAAFAGFQADNLWISGDEGLTWRAIAVGLPAAPVRAVAIHPKKKDFFYAGTEVGVFASENAGAAWSPTNEGPANVSVEDLFWMGEKLICATHGRGMFLLDLGGL